MILRRLLFLSLIVIIGTVTHSYSMFREPKIIEANIDDTSTIPEATYFKIHNHDCCKTYLRNGLWYWKKSTFYGPMGTRYTNYALKNIKNYDECEPQGCDQCSQLTHDKKMTVVSYHDKNWGLIGFMDITNLRSLFEQEDLSSNSSDAESASESGTESKMLNYIKQRLDRPKAASVTIDYDSSLCPMITFFDSNGNSILYNACDEKYRPQNVEDLKRFAEFVDLDNVTITDKRSEPSEGYCIIF